MGDSEEVKGEGANKEVKTVNFYSQSFLNSASAVPSPGDRVVVFRRSDLQRGSGGDAAPRARRAVALATVVAAKAAPINVEVQIEDSLVGQTTSGFSWGRLRRKRKYISVPPQIPSKILNASEKSSWTLATLSSAKKASSADRGPSGSSANVTLFTRIIG